MAKWPDVRQLAGSLADVARYFCQILAREQIIAPLGQSRACGRWP
jgi:hypothetical protein